MYRIGSSPFLRLSLALAMGIFLGYLAIPDPQRGIIQILGLSCLGICILMCIILRDRAKSFQLKGGLVLASHFLLGLLLALNTFSSDARSYFFRDPGAYENYTLRFLEPPEEREKSYRAAARVISGLDSNLRETALSGRIIVYWPKSRNNVSSLPQYGDILLVHNSAMNLPAAAFPGDFDLRGLMRYRDLGQQIFLSHSDWLKTGNRSYAIFRLAYKLRSGLLKTLDAHFSRPVAGLLASLLIGVKDHLEKEDIRAFTVSGTMHVLAVSGMHVGLIYIVLVFLLTGRTRLKKARLYQGILIISILWIYALITGLSPSVIRAALMFSIIHIGLSLFQRAGQAMNALFAAAWLQLVIDPMNLMDLGFQLSYLAVMGILYLHPWMSLAWQPSNRLLRYAWQLCALSLAATLGTIPATLYHFGTFPLWFIPANLIIVPLSTLLICVAIGMLVLLKVPLLGKGMVFLCAQLAALLSFCTRSIAALPHASIPIQPDAVQAFLLFCFILGLALCLAGKRRGALWIASLSVLLFGSWSLLDRRIQDHSAGIILAEIHDTPLLCVRSGDSALMLSAPIRRSLADSLYQSQQRWCQRMHLRKVYWESGYGGSRSFGPYRLEYDPFHALITKGTGPGYCLVWDPRAQFSLPDDTRLYASYKQRNFFYNGREPELLRNSYSMPVP